MALGCIELKKVLLTPYLVRRVRKSSILFKSVSPCLSLERTSGQDSQSSKRVFLFSRCSRNHQCIEQRKTGLLHSVATPCSPPARIPGKGWDLRSPSLVCILQEPFARQVRNCPQVNTSKKTRFLFHFPTYISSHVKNI